MSRLATRLPLLTLVALAVVALTSRTSPADEDEIEIKVIEEDTKLPGPFANRTGPNRARALAKVTDGTDVWLGAFHGARGVRAGRASTSAPTSSSCKVIHASRLLP